MKELCNISLDELMEIANRLSSIVYNADHVARPVTDVDCAVKVKVNGNKMKLTVSVNGQDDIEAVSFVNGTGYIDFMKSFSYAAHMAYKMAQQGAINDF